MRGGNWRALEIAGACDGDMDSDLRHYHYENVRVSDAVRWYTWLVENGEDR